MLKRLGILVLLGSCLVGIRGLLAQQDSGGQDPVRAQRLRRLIEEKFAERLTVELRLSDEQATKVRAILATWATKRRAMERDDRQLRQQLGAQMRPGVAANPDSVNRVVDALANGRIAYAETFRDEWKELGTVLTPVQRGQYVLMRDRLMQRVQQVVAERRAQVGGLRRQAPP